MDLEENRGNVVLDFFPDFVFPWNIFDSAIILKNKV